MIWPYRGVSWSETFLIRQICYKMLIQKLTYKEKNTLCQVLMSPTTKINLNCIRIHHDISSAIFFSSISGMVFLIIECCFSVRKILSVDLARNDYEATCHMHNLWCKIHFFINYDFQFIHCKRVHFESSFSNSPFNGTGTARLNWNPVVAEYIVPSSAYVYPTVLLLAIWCQVWAVGRSDS